MVRSRSAPSVPCTRRLAKPLVQSRSLGRTLFFIIVFALAGLGLLYLVVTTSLVAYLANSNPNLALRINPTDPVALLNVAERKFIASLQRARDRQKDSTPVTATPSENGTQPDPNPADPQQPELRFSHQDAEEIRDLVARALLNDPINARGVRIMGLLADLTGDKERAELFMRAAARLSPRDTAAVGWLVQRTFDTKMYADTVAYADLLLRAQPSLMPTVAPLLSQVAEDREGSPLLKEILLRNPPWRSAFLQSMLNHVKDTHLPLDLLLALKATSTPACLGDIANYIRFLNRAGHYEQAYFAWLQFVSEKEIGTPGLIHNGSFESKPDGLPYNWQLLDGASARVEIIKRSDKPHQHALSIELAGGRVAFPGVSQLIKAPPGSYTVSGEQFADLRGRRGFRWRVTCLETSTVIGESSMITGKSRGWEPFEFEVRVSAENCRAQELKLIHDARSASEQMVLGSLMCDGLIMRRIAVPTVR